MLQNLVINKNKLIRKNIFRNNNVKLTPITKTNNL